MTGALACGGVHAAAPKETAAFGLALDATPDAVKRFLVSRYAPCNVVRSVYRSHSSGAAPQTAEFAINAGLAGHDPASLTPCTYSPAGEDVVDSVEARFTHPDVDPKQPLYWLQAYRSYPDVVHSEPPRVRTSFDEVRRELFRTYGKPSDERRERIVSYAASTQTSLGVVKKVEREDYLVRYLWSAKGPAHRSRPGSRRVRLRGPLRRGGRRDLALARDETAEHVLCTQLALARRGSCIAPPAGRVERAMAKGPEALRLHASTRAAARVSGRTTTIDFDRTLSILMRQTKHRSIQQNGSSQGA
jgi:hypothetical protein